MKNKTKIIFRADGDENIGLGHIYRSLALLHMLKNDYVCSFFSHTEYEFLSQELAQNKISFTQLKKLKYPRLSEKKVKDEIAYDMDHVLKGDEIVVLDGYWFGTNFQKKVKQKGCILIVIDDLHEIEFYADLIINHSPKVYEKNYHAQKYTKYALGNKYVLLRPKFLSLCKLEQKPLNNNVLFICFGGSDFKNLTIKALKIALKLDLFEQINIVVGQSYSKIDLLKKVIGSNKCISLFKNLNENEMIDLILKSSTCIVPSSGILLEVLALKSKVISGLYIENQKFIYNNYKEMNCFIDAGKFSNYSIRKAYLNVSKANDLNQIFDGLSQERLLKKINDLVALKTIQMRFVEPSDLDLTYVWATDPVIRNFSFNNSIITKKEHSSWFKHKIADKNCFYYLATKENEVLGSVRFDVNKGKALISYLLDSRFHGQGFGLLILEKGLERLLLDVLKRKIHLKEILGYVLNSNYPSLKIFENLGFKKKIDGERIIFVKKINLF